MSSNLIKCNLCNKYYSSKQSLSNHIKNIHKNNKITSKNNKIIIENKYKCNYCENIYKHKQSRTKHHKTCKDNKDVITNLQNKVIELENKILKINNSEIAKSINNSNNTNSNNVNNGVINNITIKFGAEDLSKILTKKDMIKICSKKYASIEESIQMVHFNKDKPELHNVIIKNLKDDIAFVHDGEDYIAKDKNDVISELIELHLENIEMILDEENENNIRNKIDEKTIKKLEDLRDRLDDENQFKINEKTYDSYRAYKINQIKLLIYNCIKKLKIIMNK